MIISDKKALIIDYGYTTFMADRLAREYGKVWYYNAGWKGQYPTGDKQRIGTGFKSYEVIYKLWDYVDKADIVIFLALYDADLQDFLRAEGHLVYGSGRAEVTEIDKWLFTNLLIGGTKNADQGILKKYKLDKFKINLPIAETLHVYGLDELNEILSTLEEDEWYIKSPTTTRGDMETKKFTGKNKFRTVLRELAYEIEYEAETKEFLLVKKIESDCESGYDELNIDGESSPYVSIGNEAKDEAWAGRMIKAEDMPKPLEIVRAAMAPVYKLLGCRGNHSTEIRITDDGLSYFIDDTLRIPSPPGEAWSEWLTEYGKDIWDVANGNAPKMKHEYKYAAEIMIHSEWLAKNWVPVEYPKSIRQYVKLRNNCVIEGHEYSMPFDEEKTVGAIIGFGNTMEEAIEMCKENAEDFWCHDMFMKPESFDEIIKASKVGHKWGIKV
jgi:hypothetical protein